MTASEALAQLKAGNERFAAGRPRQDRTSVEWRQQLVTGQDPFAVIVGCADSRVPIELVFDQGFGDLFVIRNAGHVMTTDVLGSIEYAGVHLHVSLVVVLGHEGCGAVTAALSTLEATEKLDEEPLELQEILRLIQPGLTELGETPDGEARIAAAVEANVRYSVKQLTDLISERNVEGISVVGAVYGLGTGAVRFLE